MPARIKIVQRSKFNVARGTVGFKTDRGYHSKREEKRADQLALLEMAGTIRNLREQVRVPLVVNGKHVCAIIMDFVYEENGVTVWEDSKGFKTEAYKIKAKLFTAIHGTSIRET